MRDFRPRSGFLKRGSAGMPSAERKPFDICDIPENRRGIIDDSLDRLGVTMYSGALRNSVCDVAGALIMRRESGETSLKNLQDIIDSSMRDLGFHIEAREECDGDAEKAAELNLERISQVVRVAYGETLEIEEIPQDLAEIPAPEPEKTMAA